MKKLFIIVSFSIALPVYTQVAYINAFPNLSFTQPVFLTHAYDNTNRIFVVQQNGIIQVFANDSNTSSSQIFLNLTNKIITGSERGLLGLAFHPDYENNRYFYVDYTRAGDGATVISRFTTQAGNPNKADSLSEQILLTIAQPFSNHNGGMVMFGLDGFLYIGMGDGGSGGDPGNRAQNTNELLGKILRIDVNNPSGGNNYGIPSGNPFAITGGRPEIFCIGMRNPWRFSQDPVTGTIYCGDVGQDSWEEIDTLAAGGNYGWRCYEGYHTFNTSGCGAIGTFTFPINEYKNGPPETECSVTGGYVYRGSRVPWLVGRYVFSDYCSRRTWKLLLSGGVVSDSASIGIAPSNVYSLGVDQNNELYTLCSNNIIYKFQNTIIGINNGYSSTPDGFTLQQNYPNPFNPSTGIKYSIGTASDVKISIFDALGNEVSTLINEYKQAGQYEVKWDGSRFASGIYFYSLEAGNVTLQRKMILIK